MQFTNRCIACLLSIVFFFPIENADGQRMKDWSEMNESRTFIQGTYSLPVSSAIHLISFHSYFQPIEIGEEQEMFFTVCSPEESDFLLKMQERRIVDYYMLESQPGTIEEGENQLGPWNIDGYFKSYGIPSSNLGILFSLSEEKTDYVIPVTVAEKDVKDKSDEYKAVFRLAQKIKGGTYTVYKGEHEGVLPEDKIIQESRVGQHRAGSIMQISIAKKDLDDYSGWVTVQLVLEQKGVRTKLQEKFYFYHTP